MGFLTSPYRWADGEETYLQYLATEFFYPIVAAIFAYIVLGSIFMCWRGKAHKISKFALGMTLLSAFATPYLVLFYPISSKLDLLEYKARSAWDYKDEGVAQLTRVKAAVDIFGDSILCQSCGDGATTITEKLTDPFQIVINEISNFITDAQVDTIGDLYTTIKYYAIVVEIVMVVLLIVCAVLVWSAQLFPLKKTTTNCKRRLWYIGSITLSILLAIIAIVFFAGAVIVSDTCNDYVSTIDYFLNEKNLNFYLSCDMTDETEAGRFPPILSKDHPEIINILKNHEEQIEGLGYITCLADAVESQEVLKFEKGLNDKFHLHINISDGGDCECNCSATAGEDIFTQAGNFGPNGATGIWKLIECKGPGSKLAEVETSICSLFPTLFAYFVLTLTMMTHVLFMYFVVVSDDDASANKY